MTFNGWQRMWVVVSVLWMLAVGAFGVLDILEAYNTEPRPIVVGVSIGALATFLAALIVPPAALYGLGAAVAWVNKRQVR
jgi:hypothetical protein